MGPKSADATMPKGFAHASTPVSMDNTGDDMNRSVVMLLFAFRRCRLPHNSRRRIRA